MHDIKTYRVRIIYNKVIDQTITKRILLALLESCRDARGRITLKSFNEWAINGVICSRHLPSQPSHPAAIC